MQGNGCHGLRDYVEQGEEVKQVMNKSDEETRKAKRKEIYEMAAEIIEMIKDKKKSERSTIIGIVKACSDNAADNRI